MSDYLKIALSRRPWSLPIDNNQWILRLLNTVWSLNKKNGTTRSSLRIPLTQSPRELIGGMQQLSAYSWCGLQPASSPPSRKKYCSLVWATRDKTRPNKQLSNPRSLPTSSPASEISATPGPRTSLPASSTHVVSPLQTTSLDNWNQDSQAEEQLIPPDSSLSAAHQFIYPPPAALECTNFYPPPPWINYGIT